MIRLHPSALVQLCELQGYYRYVERIRVAPDVSKFVGTTVHAAAEGSLKHKAANGGDILPFEDFDDLSSDAFDLAWKRAGEIRVTERDHRGLNGGQIRALAKDQHMLLARTWHRRVIPTIQVERVEDVERRIGLKVSGSELELTCRLDVLERTACVVHDFKTRKDRPDETEVQNSVQLHFYAFALERTTGAPHGMAQDVVTKHKKPQTWRVSAPPPRDHGPLLRRIEVTDRSYRAGVFRPIDPSSQVGRWLCTSERCEYFDRCPYGRARRRAVPVSKPEEIK